MSGGDGRLLARFGTPPSVEPRYPRAVGLCRTCQRQMWTNLSSHRGQVAVSRDGVHCDPCFAYIRRTGKDPRDQRGNPAERIPAERPESDPSWRAHPDRRCDGIDGGPFEPDPLPEEDGATPADYRDRTEMRRYIATFVCGPCPVAAACRGAAAAHGWEGMWGGRFFTATAWVDPRDYSLHGPTLHTREPDRVRWTAELAARGYDADGEPFPAEESA